MDRDTMLPSLPEKRYFKIGEVAKIAEVPPHVLRYWESEFPVIRPKRTKSGQRLYQKQDVKHILEIQYLLHKQGYTISGAKKVLQTGLAVQPECFEQTGSLQSPSTTEGGNEILLKLQQIKKELQEIKNIVSA